MILFFISIGSVESAVVMEVNEETLADKILNFKNTNRQLIAFA